MAAYRRQGMRRLPAAPKSTGLPGWSRNPTTGTTTIQGQSKAGAPGEWHLRAPSAGSPKGAKVFVPRSLGASAQQSAVSAGATTPPTPPDQLPVPISPPPDASYEDTVRSLTLRRDQGLTDNTAQRTTGLADYGYLEGPGGALNFDPNNPYSKAALLKKTYDTSRATTAQGMGAGGQLYSGAYQNAQDLVNRNQGQADDELSRSLTDFLARNTAKARDLNTDYETGVSAAEADRMARIDTNPLYDPQPTEEGRTPSATTPGPGWTPADFKPGQNLTRAQLLALTKSPAWRAGKKKR